MKELVGRQLVALCLIGAVSSLPGKAHACGPFDGLDVLLIPITIPYALATVGLGLTGAVSVGGVTAAGTLPLRLQDNSRANRLTARAFEGGYVLGSTLPQRLWDNDGAQLEVDRAFAGR
jgi:hypothetical protein